MDSPDSVALDGAGGVYVASRSLHIVFRVAADGTLRVIAGTGTPGFSGDGGPAVSARLNTPLALAVDSAGNLFIADSVNHCVRKVTPVGIISTVAGGPANSAPLSYPSAVAVQAGGNLFVADASRIRKVTPNGIITTIAGNGIPGFSGDQGAAATAQIHTPQGLAVDALGNVFIADTFNQRIRKVSPDGLIITVAGNETQGFNGDGGPATSAQLAYPHGITVDTAGNLFIADWGTARVRKVTSDGIITTAAGKGLNDNNGYGGYGGDGGPATLAQLSLPNSVAADSAGDLFIADEGNNRVRKVAATGIITTIAGISAFGGDGGPATSAQFNLGLQLMKGVTADTAGTLFIADTGNQRIRKITPDGLVNTVAGNGTDGWKGDGGAAVLAQLSSPTGVAVDALGDIFIADYLNHCIRKVSPSGVITTAAGTGTYGYSGDGGPATAARLWWPAGVTVDKAGNLFIADSGNNRVRKVDTAGIITTVAGNGIQGFSGDGRAAASAQLQQPRAVAVDAAGNLFIADTYNNSIRKVTPAGVITTIAGTRALGYAPDGGPATSAPLSFPAGVAVDSLGNLFIADSGYNRIRKVTTDGIISTVAGTGLPGLTGDGGPAASANIYDPGGVALDASGNLFIADRNSRIRKVTFEQQTTTFLLGNRGGVSLSSSGTLPATVVGYAGIQPDPGTTAPSGLAIFGFRQNGVLVSEATVPALQPIRAGRIFAEMNGPVNTGLAIANPNDQPVTISFFFTSYLGGHNGNFGSGTATVPAHGQLAAFLDQPPFNGAPVEQGTFTFNSSAPVAAVAMRGVNNERGEFLLTTLQVADLSQPLAAGASRIVPHFVDGGGWTTQIELINPLDVDMSGSIFLKDPTGTTITTLQYGLPPRGSQKLTTSGLQASVQSGFVKVVPNGFETPPAALAVFSFRQNGVTVTEAGVAAMKTGSAFRLYAEAPGASNVTGSTVTYGSVQTGLAIVNQSDSAVTVMVEANYLNGSSAGPTGRIAIPAQGQVAKFLKQIPGFESLSFPCRHLNCPPFEGTVRVSSSSPISVIGLRARYNERDEFLITTTPAVNESDAPATTALFFPQIVDSGGYYTSFILFNAQPGISSGTIQFLSQGGGAWNLKLQ